MNSLVRLAYEICGTAYAGQVDKAGMPYHLHPERVAARCSTDAETIVALLHDSIHDLEDNMDIRRLPDLDDKTFERLRKYLKEYHFLKI